MLPCSHAVCPFLGSPRRPRVECVFCLCLCLCLACPTCARGPARVRGRAGSGSPTEPSADDPASFLSSISKLLRFDNLPLDQVMGIFDKYSDADGNVTLPVFHGCIQQLLRRSGANSEVRFTAAAPLRRP